MNIMVSFFMVIMTLVVACVLFRAFFFVLFYGSNYVRIFVNRKVACSQMQLV
jgi:hypothetical protein